MYLDMTWTCQLQPQELLSINLNLTNKLSFDIFAFEDIRHLLNHGIKKPLTKEIILCHFTHLVSQVNCFFFLKLAFPRSYMRFSEGLTVLGRMSGIMVKVESCVHVWVQEETGEHFLRTASSISPF